MLVCVRPILEPGYKHSPLNDSNLVLTATAHLQLGRDGGKMTVAHIWNDAGRGDMVCVAKVMALLL